MIVECDACYQVTVAASYQQNNHDNISSSLWTVHNTSNQSLREVNVVFCMYIPNDTTHAHIDVCLLHAVLLFGII